MSIARDYHHSRLVDGDSFRIDTATSFLSTTGVTSWRTFRNCYIELMHPQAMLFAGTHESHRIRFESCQIICHDDATEPAIGVIPTTSNLSAIELVNCDIKGRANATCPAVVVANNGTGGSPHCVFDGVYFSGMPAGCLELSGLNGCLISRVDRSDLGVTPTAPGIHIRPGTGGVWGSYHLTRCFLTGGDATNPDLKVEDTGPGAIHVGVDYSRFEYVDMAGAGTWDDGRNHVSVVV